MQPPRDQAPQWRSATALITPLNRFAEYANAPAAFAHDVIGIAVPDETLRRTTAAGLTHKSTKDVHPSPKVWNQSP
ncbi:hypothetical protein ACN27F_30745 [Solwaraspora sp. WMMB335]|uniref:hypothetical protein n=1 Tax=Solwaraspora sp. WMMB335 TaxID=3404118 RepID=UPI003B936447